jgi:hypothetical protein
MPGSARAASSWRRTTSAAAVPKLLVATEMQEHDSDIHGIEDNLGAGVFCCPYCDGWEFAEPRPRRSRDWTGFG